VCGGDPWHPCAHPCPSLLPASAGRALPPARGLPLAFPLGLPVFGVAAVRGA